MSCNFTLDAFGCCHMSVDIATQRNQSPTFIYPRRKLSFKESTVCNDSLTRPSFRKISLQQINTSSKTLPVQFSQTKPISERRHKPSSSFSSSAVKQDSRLVGAGQQRNSKINWKHSQENQIKQSMMFTVPFTPEIAVRQVKRPSMNKGINSCQTSTTNLMTNFKGQLDLTNSQAASLSSDFACKNSQESKKSLRRVLEEVEVIKNNIQIGFKSLHEMEQNLCESMVDESNSHISILQFRSMADKGFFSLPLE